MSTTDAEAPVLFRGEEAPTSAIGVEAPMPTIGADAPMPFHYMMQRLLRCLRIDPPAERLENRP